MKKIFSLLLCVGALASLVLVSTRTSAQQPANGQPAAPAVSQPLTRVAVLNLTYVVKNYVLYTEFTTTMKSDVEAIEARVKGKKAQYDANLKEINKAGITPQTREGYEKALKQIQREMEDITNEGKATIGKKSDELMVALYKDIQDTANRYAAARGYEMVLHFNDAAAGTNEHLSPANISRKMQAGALIPLYVHPGLDISPLVVETLNQTKLMRDKQRAAAGGGQPK